MRTLFLLLMIAEVGFAADPVKVSVELGSDQIGILGMPLAESMDPIYRVRLTAIVDEQGEGEGVLILDPTGLPEYDDFGFPGLAPDVPLIELNCKIKRIKRMVKTYVMRRRGAAENETEEYKEDWRLYSITGPKITTRLFLAMVESRRWSDGRLIVKSPENKVKYVVDLRQMNLQEPCHPGCFPAGTQIMVPGGTTTIEKIKAGDLVTTVSADGVFGQTAVASVFVTRNRLIEVHADDGVLTTTETQPLALATGELRAAGKLQAGDSIFKSGDRKRQEIVVRKVVPTDRTTRVFNLILDKSQLFVADNFLARSTPPRLDDGPVAP